MIRLNMKSLLHDLQKKQLVWTAADLDQHKERVATGYKQLDEALNGGFPQSGLIHINSTMGCGELRLVIPAIVSRQHENRLYAFIAPPHLLSAEFLIAEGIQLEQVLLIQTETPEQALWSAEQCAKSGACSAVDSRLPVDSGRNAQPRRSFACGRLSRYRCAPQGSRNFSSKS